MKIVKVLKKIKKWKKKMEHSNCCRPCREERPLTAWPWLEAGKRPTSLFNFTKTFTTKLHHLARRPSSALPSPQSWSFTGNSCAKRCSLGKSKSLSGRIFRGSSQLEDCYKARCHFPLPFQFVLQSHQNATPQAPDLAVYIYLAVGAWGKCCLNSESGSVLFSKGVRKAQTATILFQVGRLLI